MNSCMENIPISAWRVAAVNRDLEGFLCARHCSRLQECGRRPNNIPSLMELVFGGGGQTGNKQIHV